jgi:hypothetical protein
VTAARFNRRSRRIAPDVAKKPLTIASGRVRVK